jgi:ATP-dependent DNA ligase
MLAKLADELPEGDHWLYEPKWDGFRAIVFRGGGSEVYLQSRDSRPLDRYFPELHDVLAAKLPERSVWDGEIVIATPHGLDFDLLQLRLHPAASRVAKLAKETPSSFVAFDLLAVGGRDLRDRPQSERRALLERALQGIEPPLHLTPMTRDRSVARDWLDRFEGAGLDGVVAKQADAVYEPGRRVMVKVKHARTADCVVAGFRWHKSGKDKVGSLLLGLYDDEGRLHHVGVTSSFTMARRQELLRELEPLRRGALEGHPWREWAELASASDPYHSLRLDHPAERRGRRRLGRASEQSDALPAASGEMVRMPGGQSRWSAGKDLSWQPLRIERVCEVRYDHLQGDRFRHAATFLRWRPDRQPQDCRYDQLEVTQAYELEKVFGAADR